MISRVIDRFTSWTSAQYCNDRITFLRFPRSHWECFLLRFKIEADDLEIFASFICLLSYKQICLHSHYMRRYWFYVKIHFRNFRPGVNGHNSRSNYRIELSFGIFYRSRKSKCKFVNQPHLTKIVKMKAFFVLSKFFFFLKSKI